LQNSNLKATAALYNTEDCENDEDGGSHKTALNWKPLTSEATSYSQKDCAGVQDSDEIRTKKKYFSFQVTDVCQKHWDPAVKMWIKGEVKDYGASTAGGNASDGNNTDGASWTAMSGALTSLVVIVATLM